MIQLYYYQIIETTTKGKLDKLLSILSSEERQRAAAFKKEKDFIRYTVGKLMTRNVIAGMTNIRPEKIVFRTDKYDRPFLDYPDLDDSDFNLSHSGDYVVLAISNTKVGIDIEKIKPIDLSIANDCFHEIELEYLHNNPDKRLETFYKIWTLKESFIKAIGQGLSYPLKNFYFYVTPNNARINVVNSDYGKQWNFKMYNINDKYKLAVCAKGTIPPTQINPVTNLQILQ